MSKGDGVRTHHAPRPSRVSRSRQNRRAYGEVYEACRRHGVTVDRYGLCLDWAMGYPLDLRRKGPRGTGVMLDGPETFAALTHMAPVAPHFGDFMFGFPGAFDSIKWVLAAGSTAIGNLGQWFTFRLPEWDGDDASAHSTIKALGLMAAQPVAILVHSNLDDGFAASFSDLPSALGFALLERHIVENLIGGHMAHCYGHHFSESPGWLAFLLALVEVSSGPDTVVYGNTTSYRDSDAAHYASLSAYLEIDIVGRRLRPTGHAINPVPVSENERIPGIDEIVDAQLFADRLVELTADRLPPIDMAKVEADAAQLTTGAMTFRDRVLAGLGKAGIDTGDVLKCCLSCAASAPGNWNACSAPASAPPPYLPGSGRSFLHRSMTKSPAWPKAGRAGSARANGPDRRRQAQGAGRDDRCARTRQDVAGYGRTGPGCDRRGRRYLRRYRRSRRAGHIERRHLVCISTYNGIALGFIER